MLLKQPGILAICLPGEIEGVADQRDRTQKDIDSDVSEHSSDDDA
jgi:hypothetical protein